MAPSLLSRLVHRLRPGRRLDVWYHPSYRLPFSGLDGMSHMEPRRADYVAWYLLGKRAVRAEQLHEPERISYADLALVHPADHLARLADAQELARIFAVDPSDVPVDETLQTVRLACGGTLAAARAALARRCATLNLLGGFHHAAPTRGAGSCPVNDIAVALAVLRREGFGGQVAVLDLDAHPPDGTALCLVSDTKAWVGSLSSASWEPLSRVDETVLPRACDDRTYLYALERLLGRMPRAALAFVLAGGDVLAGDPLGGLGLSLEGARRRDARVARALQGVPSVWLPGGGYHPDSWRLLAGSALVLLGTPRRRVSRRFDPLSFRYAAIARSLAPRLLGQDDALLSEADLKDLFGGAGGGERRLLDFYTAEGLELALHRYGHLAHMERLGYRAFEVELDSTGTGDRLRLWGSAAGRRHLLSECVLAREKLAGETFLFVHWLTLRNPLARFSALRPPLPGQDAPGLGMSRETSELLVLMARRLGLAGLAFRPAWYHMAYIARHWCSFVDPARQGRFEALVRDLAGLPLLEATHAVANAEVRLDGAAYAWEADDMVYRLDATVDPAWAEAVRQERERVRFTRVPPGPPAVCH